MNQKIKALERHASGLEKPDYTKYTVQERLILEKADEIMERLKKAANPDDRFGTLAATCEDRKNLVEAAEISANLKTGLEVE